jgi:1-deoxy-D-xylulose 5-phosphate reductoisomerase
VRFADIPGHLESVMARHPNAAARTIEDLLETDGWARAAARELIATKSVAA